MNESQPTISGKPDGDNYPSDQYDIPKPNEIYNRSVGGITDGIPLEARLSFVDKQHVTIELVSKKQIAMEAGVGFDKVEAIIEELGIPSYPGIRRGREFTSHPHYTVGVIKEEQEWLKAWKKLPAQITLTTMAEFLGRSRNWVRKTVEEIDAEPTDSYQHTGRDIPTYEKDLLKTLRRINMSVPMDGDWLTISRALEYSGLSEKDRDWAVNRLKEADVTSQRRRSSWTGEILEHCPPDALAIIKQAKETRAAPGGEWLTESAVATITGRSRSWVRRRMTANQTVTEPRLDDQGVTRLHFPPETYQPVIAEAEEDAALPQLKDELTAKELGRILGHGVDWIYKATEDVGIAPRRLRRQDGSAHYYFSRSTEDRLRAYEAAGCRPTETIEPAQVVVNGLRKRR